MVIVDKEVTNDLLGHGSVLVNYTFVCDYCKFTQYILSTPYSLTPAFLDKSMDWNLYSWIEILTINCFVP